MTGAKMYQYKNDIPSHNLYFLGEPHVSSRPYHISYTPYLLSILVITVDVEPEAYGIKR